MGAAPTAAAAPQVFMQEFLTQYGTAMQVFGFFGWFIVGLVSIVFCVLGVLAYRKYAAYVDFITGAVAETGLDVLAADDAVVSVEEFVE